MTVIVGRVVVWVWVGGGTGVVKRDAMRGASTLTKIKAKFDLPHTVMLPSTLTKIKMRFKLPYCVTTYYNILKIKSKRVNFEVTPISFRFLFLYS